MYLLYIYIFILVSNFIWKFGESSFYRDFFPNVEVEKVCFWPWSIRPLWSHKLVHDTRDSSSKFTRLPAFNIVTFRSKLAKKGTSTNNRGTWQEEKLEKKLEKERAMEGRGVYENVEKTVGKETEKNRRFSFNWKLKCPRDLN